MVIVQDRSLRKPSGGRNTSARTKRKHMIGSRPSLTTIGTLRVRARRAKGGASKEGLFSIDKVNLFDPKTKKHAVVKLVTVKDNSANRNFVRRNIMTKGSIIETEKGLAVITSRPGQEKMINAVLK
ncbi:MAG: 30S ribosomal protein S8e [Candidatus Woesearchaeota archaeon]|jgi:small subunit ribosomal protein S8e